MAPTAPKAPAWFTVAIPAIMEPRTTNINARGGIKMISTSSQKFLSIFPLWLTDGANLGKKNAKDKILTVIYLPFPYVITARA